MCSTCAVAESTNCSCVRNPAQAYAEMAQEQPVTTWIITMLARGVWAVLVLVAGVIVWIVWGAWEMATARRPVVVPVVKVEPAPQVTPTQQSVYSWDMSTIKARAHDGR